MMTSMMYRRTINVPQHAVLEDVMQRDISKFKADYMLTNVLWAGSCMLLRRESDGSDTYTYLLDGRNNYILQED